MSDVTRYAAMIEIETTGGDMRMAEATIKVAGHVVGYVGGSGHEDTVRREAERAVARALGTLIAAQPGVERLSRFGDLDDDPHPDISALGWGT